MKFLIKALVNPIRNLVLPKPLKAKPSAARAKFVAEPKGMSSKNSYIAKQADLDELVLLIRKVKLIAVDTEFTRRTTYYPVLSIIQVGIKDQGKKSFIIDCLAGLDFSEIFAIIADAKIIKIVHSAMQDLQIFHHESGLVPQGIKDTQIMANFSGFDFNIGYSGLVEKMFGIILNKKEQNSDWQRRPLSKKQIEYAFLDVVYLEEIYEKFCQIMMKKNRLKWCEEETESFINKILFRGDESLSKKFSFRNKNQKQISQIKNLMLWREQKARQFNVPRQHFLRDEVIERIVADGVVGLNIEEEFLKEIIEILDRQEEVLEKRKNFPMSEKQKLHYQEAKKIIGKIAEKEKFKEQFLITSSCLEAIVCKHKPLNEILVGWRYHVFGDELQQLINS